MARPAPTKSTTYGGKTRGKVNPKKDPSPTSDDENNKEDAPVGMLLEEMEDDVPPSKSKSKSTKAKTPAAKPKSAMKPPRKVTPPSLPPSSKVITKSKLSNEIKPSPPSKSTSKGNDSESEFDTDEEEEKVNAKSLPKPIKGKKGDSSKLPSSNGSSTKSSNQSKTSSTTRGKKEVPKKDEVSAQHPPSDDLDDEFPGFDTAMLDAVDKVVESQGLSSSPTTIAKGKKAPSPIPVLDSNMEVDGLDEEQKPAESDSPLSEAGVEDVETKDEDEVLSSHESDSESGSNSQSPEPKSRSPIPRAQKLQALKRQAEYDSNTIDDSEGGTAGLLLADLSPSSPSKKARLSAPSTKSSEEVVDSINKAVRILSSRRPASVPAPIIKSARGKKAVGASFPPIDYEAMIAPYGKEVVQRLMLKQFDSIKKCDWFELSVELAEEGVTRAGDKKKGKKEKESIISANELHELFHNAVMPALRAGKALWVDESAGASSPESYVVKTPEADEDMDEGPEYESEEEAYTPKVTRGAPAKRS